MIAVARHAYTPAKPVRIRWDRASIFAGLIAFWTVVAVSCAHAGEVCEGPKVIGQVRLDSPTAVDGDTLKSSGGQRYRIWGVNSVERGEAGYSEATRALHNITRETLACYVIDVDRYQRPVVRCFNSKGDVAAQLIAAGTVVDMPRYSHQFYGAACWGGWR